MNRTLLAACALSLIPFATAAAQGFGSPFTSGMPARPPAADPFGGSMRDDAAPSMPGCGAPVDLDPSTRGEQLAGKDLARAIATVTSLPWFDDLDAARLESAATGKPILWLQALGDLEGFA